MEGRFVIYSVSSETENVIQISEYEFNRLLEAKEKLVSMLHIEEKFNFVVENYSELEQALINITLNKMFFPIYTSDWSLSVTDIHLVNRRLINFLTTSRLYIDQIPHDLKQVTTNKPEMPDVFKRNKSQEYDSYLGYRVMEALRNYVQHRGLPVHLLSYKVDRVETLEGSKIRNRISPMLRISDLAKDKQFKSSVLEELKLLGEKVNIKSFVREYIQSISRLQRFIRDILKEDIEEWEDCINNAYHAFTEQFGQTQMISIAKENSNGFAKKTVHIMSDIIKRRKWLEKKNSELDDIVSVFATTEF